MPKPRARSSPSKTLRAKSRPWWEARTSNSSRVQPATQALRQVGSTFKPFVYAACPRERTGSPCPRSWTSRSDFTDGLGRVWAPSNYDGKFKGRITLRQALIESMKHTPCQVASTIGITDVVFMARRFGLWRSPGSVSASGPGGLRGDSARDGVAFTVFPKPRAEGETVFHRGGS